jgi:asparagine synthase (glutamine-hydrolysing)
MHHYIALLWSSGDSEAVEQALSFRAIIGDRLPKWSPLAAAPGVAVYSGPRADRAMRSYVLQGATGVILGRLFLASSLGGVPELSPASVRDLEISGPKDLLRNYWGNYVAILRGNGGCDKSYVVRDCSGHIPCYYTEHRNVYIIFSSLGDIACLPLQFSVNDQHLAGLILGGAPPVHSTGLNEVREALAGDCLELSDKGVQQYSIWSPGELIRGNVTGDYSEALSALRASTENSIAAWASVYNRILLYLSGGLDSSVVLGCLARQGLTDKVVCVNNFTAGTSDDERKYARAAAHMAGVPLTEMPRISEGKAFFDCIQRIPFQPTPNRPDLVRMVTIDDVNHLADQFGCETVWTGQGGDHIFLQTPHAYGAADYLLEHRRPWNFPTEVYDSAVLDRNSVWSVLFNALRYGIGLGPRQPPQYELKADGRSFLTPSGARHVPISKHVPWENDLTTLPPGKRLQIRDLASLLNRHRPLVGLEVAFQQHPLISQPLLETSLRIPTYYLQSGGRHRAMAREAFADRVPPCILEREDKGDISDNVRSLFHGSAPFLRDFLLDGLLVSRGLLERAALERVLLGRDTYRLIEVHPLWNCLTAEVWTRNWARFCPRSCGSAS